DRRRFRVVGGNDDHGLRIEAETPRLALHRGRFGEHRELVGERGQGEAQREAEAGGEPHVEVSLTSNEKRAGVSRKSPPSKKGPAPGERVPSRPLPPQLKAWRGCRSSTGVRSGRRRAAGPGCARST